MSASLVGSEMCIRDRCSSATSFTARSVRAPEGPPRALLRRPPGRSPLPVSYTHLTLPTICSV
eukprot:7000064-Alexandrium_andersonii.AAC.1